MITRQAFIDIMAAVERQNEHDRRLGKAVDQFSVGDTEGLNNNAFVYVTPLSGYVLDILARELADTEDWISWWCFDGPDWGRRAEEFPIHLGDGHTVAIRDAGELWDWVTAGA